MTMSNSSLVSYTRISPNKTSPRNHVIDTITIHCVVGQLSVETLGNIFSNVSRQASCNYGIGADGRIGMYVEEKDRSWCSSSSKNDNRAITIEVASNTTHPYKVNDKAYNSLINLLADVCKRNNIKKLLWKADKSLIGQVDKQNMTVHRWFANKSCPGDYLYNLHGKIAEEVNQRLGASIIVENKVESSSIEALYESIEIGDILDFIGKVQYTSVGATTGKIATPCKVMVTKKHTKTSKHPIHVRSVDDKGNFISGVYGWVNLSDLKISNFSCKVRVTADALNYRGGPGTSYPVLGVIKDKGIYTVVQEKKGWGQLKEKLGWINLKYTIKI